MSELYTRCSRCDANISDEVAAACRRTVSVFRMDHTTRARAAGPQKVFVECPSCGTEREYSCPRPEASHE